MSEAPSTLQEALGHAIRQLTSAGVESPRLDAELLLAHLLGRDRTWLAAHRPDPFPAAVRRDWEALLARRAAREPLPYILGYREFLGMRFEVAPGVLIPRPETEGLVEAVAARLAPHSRVLEVGAGSGCIAVGLALSCPGVTVLALEASPTAAAVARRNIAHLAPQLVTVVDGRFPEELPAEVIAAAPFAALVSNPPYIPTVSLRDLEPEVRDWEPRLATDGGEDGLDLIRKLVQHAPTLLQTGGWLALEVAAGQAEAVLSLLSASYWREAQALPDLAGVPRVVLARLARDDEA